MNSLQGRATAQGRWTERRSLRRWESATPEFIDIGIYFIDVSENQRQIGLPLLILK
jgi:hypothetical protein